MEVGHWLIMPIGHIPLQFRWIIKCEGKSASLYFTFLEIVIRLDSAHRLYEWLANIHCGHFRHWRFDRNHWGCGRNVRMYNWPKRLSQLGLPFFIYFFIPHSR